MTPLMLQKALNDFLQENVASKINVKYVNKKGETKEVNPTVVNGWILPKVQTKENANALINEEYAHIATRITEINNSDVTIKILFGIQSYDEHVNAPNGYTELCNLLERTKNTLLKKRILNKKYEIHENVKSVIAEEQEYPYWSCEMTTTWVLPKVYEEGLSFD